MNRQLYTTIILVILFTAATIMALDGASFSTGSLSPSIETSAVCGTLEFENGTSMFHTYNNTELVVLGFNIFYV